jgi:hypothetical protein
MFSSFFKPVFGLRGTIVQHRKNKKRCKHTGDLQECPYQGELVFRNRKKNYFPSSSSDTAISESVSGFTVTAMSSRDGVKSPLGWLWQSITFAAKSMSALAKTIFGSTKDASTVPVEQT